MMETDIAFILNNNIINQNLNPSTVLLDFIRKSKNLTGTKEVCKEGDCGACAVLLGENKKGKLHYKTINSCLYPICKVNGKHVVTIEGLNQDDFSPIQKAILDEGASQCGFCTPGFIISITGYLLNSKKFKLEEAINASAGNICRCTGYHSIIRSMKKIGMSQKHLDINALIESKIVPSYFKEIPEKLKNLDKYDKNFSSSNVNSFISGGTDLFVQKSEELLHEEVELIENLIPPDIALEEESIVISGSSTIEELKEFLSKNSHNFKFDSLFQLFASLPIRNCATIAGNIVNASPIGDQTIALLSLDTELLLKNKNGKIRIVDLKNFYNAYKQFDMSEEEIIEAIKIRIPRRESFFNFEKVSKRKHLDIASVNSAIYLELDSNTELMSKVSITAGGVAPIPLFLAKTSFSAVGKRVTTSLVKELCKVSLSEISPISDIRGSAGYKKLLLSQLIKAHFIELFPEIITHEVIE